MAKYRPGPLATDISGTIGSTVFSRGRSGPILRRQQPHRSNTTARQVNARANFASASQSWKLLSASLKLAWTKAAESIGSQDADPSLRLTGFSLFMQMYGTYAAFPTWSSSALPTGIASSPLLIFISAAHVDVPELTINIYGPGVSNDALVYFRAATNRKNHTSSHWRSWKWIGVDTYSNYPVDFIAGYLAAFGTPSHSEYYGLQGIVIEPGQVPSPSLVISGRWHNS